MAHKGPPNNRGPTIEQLTSGAAIQKKVLKDTIQNPLTILPASLTAGSVFGMVVLGLSPALVAIAVLTGATSIGAWIYNYFFKGEQLAREYVEEILANREHQTQEKISSLRLDCQRAGFKRGEKEAGELENVYLRLRELIRSRISENSTNLTAQRALILAGNTYEEGAAFIRRALNTYEGLREIDIDTLRKEKTAWDKQLKRLEESGDQESEIAALRSRIESHQRRLKLHEERTHELEQLFAESERREAALEIAHMEFTDLIDSSASLIRGTQSVSDLERLVTAARKVEDRLRGISDTATEDQLYLKER